MNINAARIRSRLATTGALLGNRSSVGNVIAGVPGATNILEVHVEGYPVEVYKDLRPDQTTSLLLHSDSQTAYGAFTSTAWYLWEDQSVNHRRMQAALYAAKEPLGGVTILPLSLTSNGAGVTIAIPSRNFVNLPNYGYFREFTSSYMGHNFQIVEMNA